MDKLINNIIANNTRCYFVSPHLDDAAFSAGDLMTRLSPKVPVTVVNVFTSAGIGSDSLSAKAFLKQSKTRDKTKLFESRVAEDLTALNQVGIKVINLDYVDALWRKDKKRNIYPIYRLNIISGNVSKKDNELISQINKRVKEIVSETDDNYLIFSPVGIGNHVDHIVVRQACEKFDHIIYWADFPYRLKSGNKNNFVIENKLAPMILKSKTDSKSLLCKQYKNQIDQVIPDLETLSEPEIYFQQTTRWDKLDFRSQIKNQIDESLNKDWQELWEKSEMRHFFNSPKWFLATSKNVPESKIKIITIYDKEKLIAIYPTILTKKFGIPAYSGPGGDFLDRSTLLIESTDPYLLNFLFSELLKIGNVYLNELPEEIANYVATFFPKFNISFASINFELPYGDDPFRYLSGKHKKQIKKVIEAEGDNLRVELFQTSTYEKLELVSEIESKSGKNNSNKDVFSDTELINLIKGLTEQSQDDCLLSVLYYKGEPIGYEYGFLYGSTWHLFQMGFKDGFNELSPGRVLLYLTLPKVHERGIKLIDFSRGANRLKRDFTEHYYKQYFVFYSPNHEVNVWWRSTAKVFVKLENSKKTFEFVRHIKHALKK